MRLNDRALQIITYWGDYSHTMLYFLEGERRALIDTGVDTSPERDIAPYLAYFGYKLDDVDLILNTHGHFDHVGGNPAIPRAEVYIHRDDAFMVEDAEKTFEVTRRPAMLLMGKSEAQADADKARYVAGFAKQKVTRLLQDGDAIELGKGITLKVVHTPGHSMGSVGFYWEQEGMLFLGDSAMGQGGWPGGLPIVYYPTAYARSLQKLLAMPIRVAAVGHIYESLRGNAINIKQGGQIKVYLEDCLEINNRIMEAMGRAIHRHWGAPFPVIAAEAIDLLAERMYIRREPATGLPASAARNLAAYYQDILGNL